jgi:hypothetical protein
VVVALLAIDAVLIVLHTVRMLLRIFKSEVRIFESEMFSISYDFTYGEIFGYLKSIVIASCFLTSYFRARAPIFAALGFAFVVILLDDSLQIHETFGERLAAALALGPMAGLQPHDLGELIVWSGLGLVVVAVLAFGFLRSDALSQNVALIFLGLLAVLIFFAVGADALHGMLSGLFFGARFISGVLEDGGEMVTLSVIAAAAVAVAWGCCSSSLARPGPSSGRPLA